MKKKMYKVIKFLAHHTEQTLTLLVNDLVYGKKGRRRAYKAPRTPRRQYVRHQPRTVVVHVYAGANVSL